MKLKLISFLLIAALLAGLFAGCGQSATVEVKETPAPAVTAAPEETPAPETTPAPDTEGTDDAEEEARKARYQAAYEKYAPDQTVMLVNGEPVSWADYYSWIYDVANQMEPLYEVTDWNEPRDMLASAVPDSTFGSYVRKVALGYLVQVEVIEQKAKELGIELSEAEKADLQATLDGYAERFGGQDKLEELLAGSYLSMDYFVRQNESMMLINDIYASMYGAKGEKLSEDDAVAYLKDNGYMYAKHILFRTVDENRQSLSDEEIAEKRAEAEAVLAELLACNSAELDGRFDALMQQYNEDPGMLRYPDGYYFQSGEMVPVFEEAVRSMEQSGLYPELVESDYGFHIIFCPPMQADHVLGYDANGEPYGPRAFVSAALFDNITQEWFEEAERNVNYVAGFENLDLNELFYN